MTELTPQPFQAYCHVPAFFRARGMAPASPGEGGAVPCGKFLSSLATLGFRRVVGCDPARRRFVVVFVLAPGGKYATKKPDLVSLLNSVAAEPFARGGFLEEVIVLVPKAVFVGKKNITGVTPAFQLAARTPGRVSKDIKAVADFYSTFPYELMLTDLMASRSVFSHAIATPAEVRKLVGWLELAGNEAELLRLTDVDFPVVWLGARAGQFVKVTRPSKQTGVCVEIRRVWATRKK